MCRGHFVALGITARVQPRPCHPVRSAPHEKWTAAPFCFNRRRIPGTLGPDVWRGRRMTGPACRCREAFGRNGSARCQLSCAGTAAVSGVSPAICNASASCRTTPPPCCANMPTSAAHVLSGVSPPPARCHVPAATTRSASAKENFFERGVQLDAPPAAIGAWWYPWEPLWPISPWTAGILLRRVGRVRLRVGASSQE